MNDQTISINSQSRDISESHPGQFAFALAHEIRNPLANIKLAIEMLHSVVTDKDLRIYIDIIMRSSTRIEELINELLIRQEVNKIHKEKYSIHQLLDEVIEDTSDRIKLKHITVTKEFAVEDKNIILDRSKMKIALSNIIVNAIDAMGSQNGRLNLVTKSIDGSYALLIRDNGCGISKENLKNIFKPYFTSKPGGLGVGLATTCDILRSNHVRINVKSEPGKGTIFILLFDNEEKVNGACLIRETLEQATG